MKRIYRILTRLSVLLMCCIVYTAGYGQTTAAAGADKPGSSILDSLIAVVIILFIISVITEKITQFFRRYAPFLDRGGMMRNTPVQTVWRNIGRKNTGTDSEKDKQVEREVNSLSFIIGLVIAIAFHVDLFRMFMPGDPRDVLFWSADKWAAYNGFWDYLLLALSLGLTGFFLTFGSKFFHDLLDNLLQIKNLKRKMLDDNTYGGENIQQIDEYLDKSYGSLIEEAIKQNSPVLTHRSVTTPPMHGRMMRNGRLVDCIDIHVDGTDAGTIPSTVQVKMSKGQVVTVPVNIIYSVEKAKAHAAQGSTAASAASADFQGTVCCKVKGLQDGTESLLTCSHVLTDGSRKNFFGRLVNPQPALTAGTANGSFTWAVCDNQIDAALISNITNAFAYQLVPGKPRALSPADILTTRVRVVRQAGRGIAEGTVVNYSCPGAIPIQYSDGDTGVINLILLANVAMAETGNAYTTLTAPGDSGACVYDDNGSPVGMIIAGNSMFSYAIPMVSLLQRLNASIVA